MMFKRAARLAATASAGLLLTACVSLDELDAAGARLAEWNAQQDAGQTDYVMACHQQGGCGTAPAVSTPRPAGQGCPYPFPDGSFDKPGATACPQ